ncbi:hypothetical protein ACOME3_008210 [Neoechinorhynchus agilis]
MAPNKRRTLSKKKLPGRKRSSLIGHKKAIKQNEEIISSDEAMDVDDDGDLELEEEDIGETEDQRRYHMAKELLEKLKDVESDEDLVAEALKTEYLESKGIARREIADNVVKQVRPYRVLNGHRHSPTSVDIEQDSVFSSSKDGVIIKSSLSTGKRIKVLKRTERIRPTLQTISRIKGHSSPVLCLALSKQYLLSGDRDGLLIVWSKGDLKHVHTFLAHRSALTGIGIPRQGNEIFTCSSDKTIKMEKSVLIRVVGKFALFDYDFLKALGETFNNAILQYGHEMAINALTALSETRCLSVGEDRSLRLFKVVEQSHLLFRGPSSSIDCVCAIDAHHCVTGSQDGSLQLWSLHRKKPIQLILNAHSGTWISAIACFNDLVVSGACDGFLRTWACRPCPKKKFQLESIGQGIAVVGYVNHVYIADGIICAAVAREHRLGQWNVIGNAKNLICIWTFAKYVRKVSEITERIKHDGYAYS